MTFKKKVSSWFLKNLIKPRMEKMDTPGYIIAKVGGKSELREVFLPENLLINIENEISEKYGNMGDKMLYKAGKDWGYRYGNISHFPRKNNTSESKLKGFIDLFIKYIESVYAKEIKYTLNIEEDTLKLETQKYTVCRKNGKGHVLSTGVWAGFMSYTFSDSSIEAYKPKCEGRGDSNCLMTFAPADELDTLSLKSEIDIENNELHPDYPKLNQVTRPRYADNSMKDLLEKGFFEYSEDGRIEFEGQRFLIAESSLVYILEEEIRKQDKSESILFEAAYETGKDIGEGRSKDFISDYLPALGWGEVKPMNDGEKVQVFSHPWTRYAKKSEFRIFRGLVSGIMSGIHNEEIRYTEFEAKLENKGLNLVLKK